MVEICHSKNVKCKSPNNLYFTTIHVFKVMQINGPNISSSVGAARKMYVEAYETSSSIL